MARLVGLATAATCALAMVAPGVASAAEFCVISGCASPQPTLAAALALAAATDEPDVVRLPAGNVPAGSPAQVAFNPHRVEIVGAGRGATTVTAPPVGPTLTIADPESNVRDLTLQVGANFTALSLSTGTAERIAVKAVPGPGPTTGVSVNSGGLFLPAPVVRDSLIDLPLTAGAASTGIANVGSVLPTVEGTEITAVLGYSGSGILRRVAINAQTGAAVTSSFDFLTFMQAPGSLTIENSALSIESVGATPTGIDVSSGMPLLGLATAALSARRITVAGDGSGSGLTVRTASGGFMPSSATASLDDSVITGFQRSVTRTGVDGDPMLATLSAPAFVTVEYSAVDLSTASESGAGTITDGPGILSADPRLRDAAGGDLRLRSDSPAIGAADPAGLASGESSVDLAGSPRIFGGRADMGAFEYQGRVAAALVATPNPVAVGEPVTFDASGSQTGEGSGATYRFDLDGDGAFETASGTTPTATRAFPAAGTVPVSVRVTAGDGGASSTKTIEQSVFAVADAPASPVALSDFEITNRVFRVGRKPTAISARKRARPRGTTFSYVLSGAAEVEIVIARQKRGRKVGDKCSKPTAKNRKRKPCKRFVRRGALKRSAAAGPNSVPFSGRIGKQALRPGRYRATITATDAAGTSAPASLKFRVVRR